MGNIGTWQLVIVLAIVLLLFGAKRLPEAARGLGRSLKIFKSETQGLVSGDDSDKATDSSTQAQSAPPKAVEPGVAPQPQPQQPAQQPSQHSEAAGDPAQQRDA